MIKNFVVCNLFLYRYRFYYLLRFSFVTNYYGNPVLREADIDPPKGCYRIFLMQRDQHCRNNQLTVMVCQIVEWGKGVRGVNANRPNGEVCQILFILRWGWRAGPWKSFRLGWAPRAIQSEEISSVANLYSYPNTLVQKARYSLYIPHNYHEYLNSNTAQAPKWATLRDYTLSWLFFSASSVTSLFILHSQG